MSTALIEAKNVNLSFRSGDQKLQILHDVNLRVEPAEVLAIVGASGSGKTSLLMLLAGLERATSGKINVAGTELTGLGEDELALFRRRNVAVLFQNFQLIPSLSARDNVALALEIAETGQSATEIRAAAEAALRDVGLGERMDHFPNMMSGGEQQRVGLARAMVVQPHVLLADEPTGNLDQDTGEKVIALILDLARKHETAVVLITHDMGLAQRANRCLTMDHGHLSA